MLRRVGAFRKGYYLPSVIPHEEDEGDRLKHKWLRWVEQESFKRQVPLRWSVKRLTANMLID